MLRFHSFAYAGIAFVAARGIFSEDSLSEVMTFENPWHDSARLLGKMGGLLVSATAGRAAGEALHLASLVGSDHRQPTAQN